MGDWIEWKGGECPVPWETPVDVRYADGVVDSGYTAGWFADVEYTPDWWRHEEPGCEIIAYRIADPRPTPTP